MNRIREWRQGRGWSLQKLADASGTSKSQIDKLEKGARRLTVDWMVRLAKPLGCDPRDLMRDAPVDRRFEAVRFGEAPVRGSGSGLIPVHGLTRAKNKAHFVLTDGPVDHVPRPWFLAHAKDAYAIAVPDLSMTPMYRVRQLLLVNPYKTPAPGGGVVVTRKNGAVSVREFVRMTPNGVVVREYRPRRRDTAIAHKDIAGLHAVAGAVEA